MKHYTQEKSTFDAKDVYENNFSFSPADYRFIQMNDGSEKQLKVYLNGYKVGQEIGSESYISKSNIRFLKTNNISNSWLLDTARIEYVIPHSKAIEPKDGSLLLVKDGGTGGLGEVCIYHRDTNFKDYISAGG